MVNGYLALGYACNQKCRCCPLVGKENRELITSYESILQNIERMAQLGVSDVTISGGEPTLHPHFFDIIQKCFEYNFFVHILSNGERFSNIEFSDKFIQIASKGKISVTTTFHSIYPSEHEYQNQSVGSFHRSMEGLKYLDQNHINVAIKHCITKNNYKNIPEFVAYIQDVFSDNAEIQLWGIDLCGLDETMVHEMFIGFAHIKPYLEKAIDIYEEKNKNGARILTINNIPLCTIDCYYWMYFMPPEYDNYIDHTENGRPMEANSGPISKNCRNCSYQVYCSGAYYSNFEVLGDDIVEIPVVEKKIQDNKSVYRVYCAENIKNTYFSNYVIHELLPEGYWLFNYLTNEEVILRLKSSQILELQMLLNSGICFDELVYKFDEYGLNGLLIANQLILKGIVE